MHSCVPFLLTPVVLKSYYYRPVDSVAVPNPGRDSPDLALSSLVAPCRAWHLAQHLGTEVQRCTPCPVSRVSKDLWGIEI